ncbi:olfactory receptor-like protein OLF4 [Mustela erminea]|uniref:olfactory receptor-like protein OLF4 n=1 Tax=Mustela erminea TaxID=36723 RepID=UPI0013867957|nr:olfactory receptor-like protein OLF4 [Mustela erminea]
MDPGNNTRISEFQLLGFSEKPELQPLIFGLFLSMYLITVTGNMLLILAVNSDFHLHTPMYFFLANLSFADICFTTTTIPKMLWNIQTQSKVITYAGCITQMYFFMLFTGLDIFLLTVMAYDRFVAICHPLHYTVIMRPCLCGLLVLVCWILSVFHSLLHTSMVLRLSFCTEVEIPHFFCELNQMIQLACSDTFLNNMVIYIAALFLAVGSFIGILYSYSKIVSSISEISSAKGKYKAFSTCASHLSVVSLFYFTCLGVYFTSAATQSSHSSAVASVMYTVVTPMLNPFIYSLRNKDIKCSLKMELGRETNNKRLLISGNKLNVAGVVHYLCWGLFCSLEVFSSIPQTLAAMPRGQEPPLVGTTGTEFENWEHPEKMQSTPFLSAMIISRNH